nr:Fc receptor-like A [Dasypus novemcinctus]
MLTMKWRSVHQLLGWGNQENTEGGRRCECAFVLSVDLSLSLSFAVPGTGESYAQSKAVLLFHPPWTTIFQELFPHPVLTASSYQPVKGSSVTLTCETQLSPQRPDAQLQFHFFRDGRALGSGWSRLTEAPDLH